jgi:hypothetical protein
MFPGICSAHPCLNSFISKSATNTNTCPTGCVPDGYIVPEELDVFKSVVVENSAVEDVENEEIMCVIDVCAKHSNNTCLEDIEHKCIPTSYGCRYDMIYSAYGVYKLLKKRYFCFC